MESRVKENELNISLFEDFKPEKPVKKKDKDSMTNALAGLLMVSDRPLVILTGNRYVGKTRAVQEFYYSCLEGSNISAFFAGRSVVKFSNALADTPEGMKALTSYLEELTDKDEPGMIFYTDNLAIGAEIINNKIVPPCIIEIGLDDLQKLAMMMVATKNPGLNERPMSQLAALMAASKTPDEAIQSMDEHLSIITMIPSDNLNKACRIIKSTLVNEIDVMGKFGYIPSNEVIRRVAQLIAYDESSVLEFSYNDVIKTILGIMSDYAISKGSGAHVTTRFVETDAFIQRGIKPEELKAIKKLVMPEGLAHGIASSTDDVQKPELASRKELSAQLKTQVIDQDDAIDTIVPYIIRRESGLSDPEKPIGSFLLAGPSGVGKTETAKAVARTVFGSEDKMLRIDCSELQNETGIARLLGANPMYVGAESGGQLTNFIKSNPDSVILFDEIEKADPSIYDAILLQLLDHGRITGTTKSTGEQTPGPSQSKVNVETIDATGTIIFMTSNLGSQAVAEKGMLPTGFSTGSDDGALLNNNVLSAIKQEFRVELINRFDAIIVYKPLSQAGLMKIFDIKWDEIKSRLDANKVNVHVNDSVKRWFADNMKNDKFGARELVRKMNTMIVDPLADKIIENKLGSSRAFNVNMSKNSVKITNMRQSKHPGHHGAKTSKNTINHSS